MANSSQPPAPAERLVNDFSGKAEPTREGVRALAAAISQASNKAGQSSLSVWTNLYRKACGQKWPRPSARLDRLARRYGLEDAPAPPEIILFALQSWYVLVVKLLAGHVIAAARGRRSPLVGNEPGVCRHVRSLIETMESGVLFADLGTTDPWQGQPYDGTLSAWSPTLEWAIVKAVARIARYDPSSIVAYAAGGGDMFKPLYESLFPRSLRHSLGEYYTPDWLAEHVLDQVGYCGQNEAGVLDPTCGSGTFLIAALRRWRQNNGHVPREIISNGSAGTSLSGRSHERHVNRNALNTLGQADPLLVPRIVGFDLLPLAVATARANYLLAIADLLGPEAGVETPVFARDAILDQRPDHAAFDFIVGNPPWIAWDNLPNDYRESTKPLWQRYGLFSLSGNAARHGGGKKDLSMLVLYAAADRHLAPGGRLGMVITQTLFQSKGAGDGFRRFCIGADGPPLQVLRVDDLVELRPFNDAANWTSVVVLQKDKPTTYPVKYVRWSACSASPAISEKRQDAKDRFSQCELLAQPIDPQHPTTPWIVRPAGSTAALSGIVGRASYTAHLGANSGGANAVYWLKVQERGTKGVRVQNLIGKAKRNVELVDAEIEPDLIYPLVRWIDIDRWSARPSACLLLAQDPQTRSGRDEESFRRDYPRTFEYLKRFEGLLTTRAAYRRYQGRQPFYSMYNVGPYTLSAYKVIWRRMDHRIRAAVVELLDDPLLGIRPVIPQETCVLIACESGEEAHYLCALMNSSLVHDLVASHSVAGGKGFGTPSILDYLPLHKFDPENSRHVELAALSRRLHALTQTQSSGGHEAAEIDRLARIIFTATA
jgi:hypothetical protein